MQTLDTALACFEIASVALGYKALDAVSRQPGVKVLEASVLGPSRFLLLCTGKSETLHGMHTLVRSALDGAGVEKLVDHEFLEQVDSQLLESLYSLSQVPLGESMIVVECATVSGLLASAQALTHTTGLKAIELKLHRGSARGGYGFFTGPAASCLPAAEDVRTRLRLAMREGDVEVIDSPAPGFREYFNFSGEA